MTLFSMRHETPVIFGAGASKQTGENLKKLGCSKVICLYDKVLKEIGFINSIINNIESQGIKVCHFDEIEPDPSSALINKAGELAKKEQIDGIVGIGGGSTLDMAKGVNVLINNPLPLEQYLGIEGLSVKQEKGVPLVLLPTTAGTSSEVSRTYVVTDSRTGEKTGGMEGNIIPTLAIVDPELTLSLPPHITASTGLDAMAHVVESLTNWNDNWMADTMAEKALGLIYQYLPEAVENGSNLEARAQMSFATVAAGLAFADNGTHLGHALADSISYLYHPPHGVGCAVAMPVAVRWAALERPQKVRNVANAMELSLADDLSPEAIGKEVADAIRDFYKGIGLKNMKELGVEETKIPQLAEMTASNIRFIVAGFKPDVDLLTTIIGDEFNA